MDAIGTPASDASPAAAGSAAGSGQPDAHGPRICVIGAGAGGLSAAYYLGQRGYRRVRVLETSDRVGGLCNSFTADGLAFDLGGNYVLPNYRHVRAIADDIGAALTDGRSRITWDHGMNSGKGGMRSTLSGVLQGTNFLAFGFAALRYALALWRFRSVLGPEGFANVSKVPALYGPYSTFLESFKLQPLRNLFVIPITIMGYGSPGTPGQYQPSDPDYFDDLPACYVLKYVTFQTLLVLLAVGIGLPVSWPKRFRDGYQRFWEAVAWELDVRLSAQVEQVTRGRTVTVTYTWQGTRRTEEFDALVIGCPLPAALQFLDASDQERKDFGAMRTREYFINIVEVQGLQDKIHDVMPVTAFGHPWAVVKQWPASDLCVTYSPVSAEVSDQQVRQWAAQDIALMGGTVKGFHAWRRWAYFPHYSCDAIRAGVYDTLEQSQGQRNTFIVGSAMGFELVERAVAYSQALVDKYFARIA